MCFMTRFPAPSSYLPETLIYVMEKGLSVKAFLHSQEEMRCDKNQVRCLTILLWNAAELPLSFFVKLKSFIFPDSQPPAKPRNRYIRCPSQVSSDFLHCQKERTCQCSKPNNGGKHASTFAEKEHQTTAFFFFFLVLGAKNVSTPTHTGAGCFVWVNVSSDVWATRQFLQGSVKRCAHANAKN